MPTGTGRNILPRWLMPTGTGRNILPRRPMPTGTGRNILPRRPMPTGTGRNILLFGLCLIEEGLIFFNNDLFQLEQGKTKEKKIRRSHFIHPFSNLHG